MSDSLRWILQARIPEWVAIPFSRGSFQTTDRTQVSCIAGRYFTSWATREGQEYWKWVASPFSSGSSLPRNQTGLLHCRRILYQLKDIMWGFSHHMVRHVKIVLQDDSNSKVFIKIWATLVDQCTESACNAGDPGSIPELDDPLEKGVVTWQLPGGLHSTGS